MSAPDSSFMCAACGASAPPALPRVELSDAFGRSDRPGIWRYRDTFGLPSEAPEVSLGEGDTPRVEVVIEGRPLSLKCEFLNPTGSFKDRGAAVLVSALVARGIGEVVEDSSGNAGAALAAYAARAGVRARIFVPEAASGPKRRQIEAYGAEVVSVPGPRNRASDAVLRAVAGGAVYASHAWLPYHPAGYATIAYELAAAPGGAPATVIAPAGQGGLILGLALGFEALVRSGVLCAGPKLIAVQAARCAPLARAWTMGLDAMAGAPDEPTAAEGVRVPRPARAAEVLGAIRNSGGEVLAVDEDQILPARERLARMGFFVEPTCALVLDAFLQHGAGWPGPVAAILTGSGLKSP